MKSLAKRRNRFCSAPAMLEQNQAKRHPPGLFDYCLVVDRERCIDSLPAISDDDEVSCAAVIAGLSVR